MIQQTFNIWVFRDVYKLVVWTAVSYISKLSVFL